MARSVGTGAVLEPLSVERPLGARLGLDVPGGWWPTAASLKSVEAAGYGWVQVLAPPPGTLRRAEAELHAGALRAALAVGGLRVVLHAPVELRSGDAAGDRALVGALEYAGRIGAELLVYHAANVPIAAASRRRLAAEERSLAAVARRAEALDVTIALENLAPVFPGEPRVCHDPAAVVGLIERLASPRVKMCFDLGHAHITGTLDALPAALPHVALFHVHDNLGDRRAARGPATVDPLRLDLHLPPGAGTLPWRRIAPLLGGHPAPLQLEVHLPRPEPVGLATVTAELLASGGCVA
jgi:sugar phosphate isomerase/epimerase